MPTDDAAVYELVQAIGSLGNQLPHEGSSLIDSKRAELVQKAEKLAIAAREPAENLYFQGTQARLTLRINVNSVQRFGPV
jgi:hypothetical protein